MRDVRPRHERLHRCCKRVLCVRSGSWILGLPRSAIQLSPRREYQVGEAGDGDPLKDWAKQNRQHFIAPDSRVVARYQQVMKWAKDNYEAPAVSDFQRVADSWIVAHALANGWVVVTHEKSAPRSKKRIKIPDACAACGVECLNPFEMLRQRGMSLAL